MCEIEIIPFVFKYLMILSLLTLSLLKLIEIINKWNAEEEFILSKLFVIKYV